MNMRLLGARNLSEVVPSMVDARTLSNHIVAVPDDTLYMGNCTFRFLCHSIRILILNYATQMSVYNMHDSRMSTPSCNVANL
jgi:hypothetical protein